MSVGLPTVLEAENSQNVLSVKSDGCPTDFQWTSDGLRGRKHPECVKCPVQRTFNGLSMDLINYRLFTHIINRECHRLPWGFPGQPTPVPIKTCTCVHRCGFHRYRWWVFTNPSENTLILLLYTKFINYNKVAPHPILYPPPQTSIGVQWIPVDFSGLLVKFIGILPM